MQKPVGNEHLIAVGIIGIGVLASMRAKDTAAVEVVSMALLFGGIILVLMADRPRSVLKRWWGIGVMGIGLGVMVYSAFLDRECLHPVPGCYDREKAENGEHAGPNSLGTLWVARGRKAPANDVLIVPSRAYCAPWTAL